MSFELRFLSFEIVSIQKPSNSSSNVGVLLRQQVLYFMALFIIISNEIIVPLILSRRACVYLF